MNPLTALACEPIPVLLYSWGGASVPLVWIMNSVIGLAIVVTIKSLFFARFAGVGNVYGFLQMALANLPSTIVGFLVAAPLTSGAPLFGIGALFVVALAGGYYLSDALSGTKWGWLTPSRFCVILFVLCVLSAAGALIGQNVLIPEGQIAAYFAVKFFALFVGLLGGIPLTIAIEGGFISLVFPVPDRDRLLSACVRANLWTFATIFLVAALIAIPQRLRARNFLLRME